MRFYNRLTHTGDYSGEPFRLRPWQEGPIRRLFGTLRPDGTRQYRKCFWALPRKQGKTEVVAGAALCLMMGQGRRNRKIYTAAGDTKQAKLIFDAACDMIANDPALVARTIVFTGYKRIEFPEGNSSIEVLSAVPKSKHGLGPTDVLIDEFHVVDERLVHVLTTGFGARRDPLTWMITTAGHDRTSLCYDEWQYARDVLAGRVVDPTYLPVIFAADPGDDWHSEEVWRKAMPALGDFCNIDFIREEHRKACERPRFENSFKQLYLNLWTEQATRWLSTERWAALGAIRDPDLDGRECYAGLDLGVTGDMTAFAAVFPRDDGRRGFDVCCRFWVPKDGRWREEKHNSLRYPQWERQGILTFTDGEATDFDRVERDIAAFNESRPIRWLYADRAYARHILARLQDVHGLNVKDIPQGPVTLNEAMVLLESLVLDGGLRHTGDPVLAWNVANATVKRNPTGLMHLDKSDATSRIDGLAAVVNALTAATQSGDDMGASVYESRGILSF